MVAKRTVRVCIAAIMNGKGEWNAGGGLTE